MAVSQSTVKEFKIKRKEFTQNIIEGVSSIFTDIYCLMLTHTENITPSYIYSRII